MQLILAAAGVLALSLPVHSADLGISDGVVVKFGDGAGIAVLDAIHLSNQATFTSTKDDSQLGQTGTTAGIPAKGNWKGIKLEASAPPALVRLEDIRLRYGGGAGSAALDIRKTAPLVKSVVVRDSLIGVRVMDGASPSFQGLSLIGNDLGMQVGGNATPTVTISEIYGNTVGISNLTPATVIQATGNWWGDASGPKDAVGNPTGKGDSVSSGVNYSNWSTVIPLIEPKISVVGSPTYTSSANITLNLACRNAIEYRVAENGNFTGLAFLPMVASTPFTLSSGDGIKQISVQYRATTGNLITVDLSGGILFDANGPTLTITNPANGSYITKAISVDATATDPAGVNKVEFYVDNVLAITRTTAPYNYAWDATLVADGTHTIKVIAYDTVGHSTTDSRSVSKGIAPPDTTGPALSNVTFSGATLADGATLTKSASINLSASDPSGVARIDFLLDGAVFGSNSSGNYSATLDINSVPDGAHTLTLKGYDSLNNVSTTSFNIVIAMAVPAAPTLSKPANGLVTNQKQQTAVGVAEKQTQVQIYSNSAVLGSPLAVDSNGNFSIPVTLKDGANQLQAAALNRAGASPLSNSVNVTVDASIPGTPSGLTALAQVGGKIKLSWLAVNDTAVKGYDVYRSQVAFTGINEASKANTSPITTPTFDDLPPTDGAYYYRVVAVNSLSTPSQPSNQVSAVSDNTLPKATSIVYTPLGKYDPVTGRIAQGKVNVTVNVNETLLAAPFLSITPQNGTPIAVELLRVTDTQYSGSFTITSTTPSGTAYAVFSAHDVIGNRGTEIQSGTSILIDAAGPDLSTIALTPSDPIKNDAASPVTVSGVFTLSKAMKPGQLPQLSYLLSKAGRTAVTISGLTPVGNLGYTASFTLPADAGQTEVEYLQFIYSGQDDLDNVSTKVLASNRYQVYQGNLPPTGVPVNFSAKPQPGGKVKLGWSAVSDATAYQIYRQAPGGVSLVAYQRTSGTDYTDSTTQDGTYRYAVASVRQANGQESLSVQSASLDAKADATAPDAPKTLSLSLTGAGIKVLWLAPLASDVVSYNVYRSNLGTITSTAGLTPIKTNIISLGYIDPLPSLTEHSYVATALDAAGNESPISNSAYLNFALLPVSSLSIVQSGTALPVVSWTYNNAQAVAGYDLYVGAQGAQIKLNGSLLTSLNYTDTGYANNERLYTVVAVDSNNVQIGRSLLLPKLSATVISGTPLKRGIMNRLQYQVTNSGSSAVGGIQLKIKAAGRTHTSSSFGLAAGESKTIPVIVGGYSDLANVSTLITDIEVRPNEGELALIERSNDVDVIDGSLTLTLTTEAFIRGGNGKVKYTINNTSAVDIDIVTATNTGNSVSDEMRFRLNDKDNNVLGTFPLKQFTGNVVTLSTGQTVARIPAGTSFTGDAVDLFVPAPAPDSINVQLDIDKIHYHTGQADQVDIQGMSSRQAVSLVDTAYYGQVTSVTPATSYGDQDIVITGKAINRQSGQPLPSTALRLVFRVSGFERKFDLFTDNSGAFTYTFKPQLTDAGVFKVSVVHPDILDRPDQGQFTINRVTVSPLQTALNIPRNYSQIMIFTVVAGEGTSASNVHLVYDAQYQSTGALPQGVNLTMGNPVSLIAKQSATLPVTISADNSANQTGSIIFKLLSDEHGLDPIGSVKVDYQFSEAKAALYPSPSYVETGVAQGGTITEQVSIQNKGLAAATTVNVTLTKADGTPAPAWATLVTPGNAGTIDVGVKKTFDLTFTPTTGVVDGIYTFKLHVTGGNIPAGDVNIYVSVTQNGVGNALFKASDIYTGTLDKNKNPINGLANVHLTVQNEQVATVTQTLTTDSQGEAFFQSLPTGSYKYRATATNHQQAAGRFNIKPGLTATQDIFLDYNLVTVEWSVKEITIQDLYQITLSATYETNVPAAVVVLEPTSVTLPKLNAGDVYYGEFSLTNYGLVRAENLNAKLPQSDQYIRYEFLSAIPASLGAKERITISYRLVQVQSFDPTASGGGCFSYSNSIFIPYSYACANGNVTNGSTGGYWSYYSGTACSGTGGTSTTYIGGGGGGGGGGWGGSGGGWGSLSGAACIPTCPTCQGGNGPN